MKIVVNKKKGVMTRLEGQRSPKPCVEGSNPFTPAKIKKVNLIAGEQLFYGPIARKRGIR